MSRPRGKVPPLAVVDRLAVEWQTRATHEAGHVVAALAVGLSVRSVRLAWRERSRLFGPSEWLILGSTEVTAADVDQSIVMALGGLTAEAMLVARRDGRSHRAALRAVMGKKINRAEVVSVRSQLRDRRTILTQQAAEQRVHALIQLRWPTVIAVADALADRHQLRAAELRSLVGAPTRGLGRVARVVRGGGR